MPFIVRYVAQHATAQTHAVEIHDGLAEHREMIGDDAVRGTGQALRFSDKQLVVDKPVGRVPSIGVTVIRWDVYFVWANHTVEIGATPGVSLVDWHNYVDNRLTPRGLRIATLVRGSDCINPRIDLAGCAKHLPRCRPRS